MNAGIAAGAMLLQAVELNLITCCMSVSPQVERIEGVPAALGMKEKYTPTLMIAFGYPGADAVAGASVNNWSDEQVHW